MDKPTLILIPGWGANALLWDHQVHYLTDLVEPKVLVMDHQSCRDEMVATVLDQSPDTFFLAGQSMGGWVAQKVAALAPKRVKKLFLLNTWASSDPKLHAMQNQVLQAIQAGKFEEMLSSHIAEILHPDKLKNRPFVDKIKQVMLSSDPQILYNQMQAMLDDYPSTDYLPKIQAPTLVIHGRQDKLFSLDEQRVLTDGIKSAQLAIIENCGHVSPLEQPEAVTTCMRSWIERG